MAERLAKAHRGIVLPTTKLTVGGYLDLWLVAVKRWRSPPGPTTAPASTGTSGPVSAGLASG
jgi:hypothetical protein